MAARIRIIEPLRWRDFALLTAGSSISLLGDGFFAVALAFQVYQLSDVPSALALVSLSWIVPMVLLLLLGGAIGDRFDRRRVMASADLVRAVVFGLLAALSLAGRLQLWHLIVVLPLFGAASAFFTPASYALLPDTVPIEDLAAANALLRVTRPLLLQLLGPALGGLVVGAAGPGAAILFDAASFVVSAVAVLAIQGRGRVQPARPTGDGIKRDGAFGEIMAGLRFVRAQPWCGVTLLGFAVGLMCSRGPTAVLLPFAVKNTLRGGPTGLGFILAAGGVGAIVAAAVAGQVGPPRHHRVAIMRLLWAGSFLGVALYGLIAAVWQGIAVAFTIGAQDAVATFIWYYLVQTLVPRGYLGRVSSIDYLVSLSLVPLSYALVGPLAGVLGATTVFIGGGLLGGLAMAATLLNRNSHPAAPVLVEAAQGTKAPRPAT